MSTVIDWLNKPKTVLMIFGNYPRLRAWLDLNMPDIIRSNGKVFLTTLTIKWPNGNKLILGHTADGADYTKFLGLEYDVVIGGNEQLRRRALVNRL